MNDEGSRLIAWDEELRAAHRRLHAALDVARQALDGGDPHAARRDLLLYCHGFCVALSGHHLGEDDGLFPELYSQHPGLRPTIAKLRQDHDMIATLIARFDHAIAADAPTSTLAAHLEGLAAIMTSHFRFEERELLGVLAAIRIDAEPNNVLGPF